MTGIQNSRFPNSDLTLLGLGLRLTPGLQEPYSYRAVERYDSLNTVDDGVYKTKFYTQASHSSSQFRDSVLRDSLTLSNDRWSSASLSPKMRVKFNLDSNDVQRSKSSDQLE